MGVRLSMFAHDSVLLDDQKLNGSLLAMSVLLSTLSGTFFCESTTCIMCSTFAVPAKCYDWLSSKIREAYEMSKGVNEHLCSKSRARLDSKARDKMY